MQTRKWVLALVLVVLMAAPAARADWDMGDPHKMHFPQMPGPNAAQIDYWPWVADDWKCSQTGPVDDIHFWIMEGGFTANTVVNVRIYSDDRSGAFSLPGQLLWSHDFNPGQYTLRNWAGTPLPAQQVNIQKIPDPFLQTKDTMYWLALTATGTGPNGASWLTGSPQFEDVAVHWNTNGWTRYGEGWEAYSFVITPEPATLSLLALGGLAVLRRRRRTP